jgi:hypothetical protein
LAVAVALVSAGPSRAHVSEERPSWSLTAALADGVLPDAPVRDAADGRSAQAVPRAECGPGSNPEPGMQGRVPADAVESGRADNGFTCNTRLLGREGNSGGFKVLRFVDRAGRECAYYDTTLLFPSNVQYLSDQPTGVAVLDMSNPAKPVRTTTLQTPAMQSPHESLVLNQRRGLLVAVFGNPTTYPGVVDIYDLNEDCRSPALQSSLPVGVFGHESGFAPDGRTFYATSLFDGHVTAVDVSDPKLPVPIWVGEYPSHGLTISEDGNRAYLAALGTGLIILDTSEIQARKPNPQVREVSRLTWDSLTIPQVAIPVTIGGKPFVVEIDEFSTEQPGGPFPASNGPVVGAARIIDIQDETKPKVVSDIRLAVHQPENRDQLAGDPGASFLAQGYAGHYCEVPRRDEPGIVACSFIVSGMRAFDIRDPYDPKELAYFVAPKGPSSTGGDPSNYAMSAPAFAPERGEIWYSDGNTGFYAVQVDRDVWPFGGRRAGGRGCLARRAPIGPRNVGRVRLGLTRRQLLRRVPAPRRRTARSWRWCVKGGGGRVSAAFGRGGRVALVATTAPRHGNRRVHPGTSARALRRAYPRRRAVGRALVRANPRSPRLLGVRGGRVRYVAVAYPRTIARARALRVYLRYAGVIAKRRG